MSRKYQPIVLLLILMVSPFIIVTAQQKPSVQKVGAVLKLITPEEKIGQLYQYTGVFCSPCGIQWISK